MAHSHRQAFLRRTTALGVLFSAALSCLAAPALAQPKAQKTPDMEIDPDAKPKEKEPPPLPPSDPNGWGVGGTEEEGKFAPQKKQKEQEQDDGKVFDAGRPGEAGIDVVIGFGTMRDVTNDLLGKTGVTSASFVFFGRYRVADIWTLQLRFPFTRAGITGPLTGTDAAKDDYNQFGIGNTELSVSPAFAIAKRMRIAPELAVYLPTSTGDLYADSSHRGSVAQALVNQAAAYSRGFEDNPLFASKRLGFRLGGAFRYGTDAIHLEAGTKLDIMMRTGGEDVHATIDNAPAKIHSPNIAWVTGASFFYDFLDGKIGPGLRTWLAYVTMPVTEGTRNYSGPQFVLEPAVHTKWALNADKTVGIKGGIGFILPLGGHLGGANDAAIKGFRIDASAFF